MANYMHVSPLKSYTIITAHSAIFNIQARHELAILYKNCLNRS